MTTRRDILAAGIGFVGCGLIPDALAQAPKRRQVVVGGKRVRTIDMHAHAIVPEAMALVGQKPAPAYQKSADRLKRMDEQGIDIQALSINPFWYGAPRDVTEKLIEIQNEKLAELCAAHPDRFVAYASVALQFPDLAAEQLERGVKKLGLRGAAIGGSVEGLELSNPKFHPFWKKVEDMGVVVFMHPQRTRDLDNRLRGNGGLDNTIWNPLETTLALSHMIYDGTFDRFPNVKLCCAHGGGYLPSYADRSDAVCVTFPDRCTAVPLKKTPTEYLRALYFDSLVFTPEALRHLVAQVGASQVVMGTDDPFGWTSTSVDHILNTPQLSDAQRAAILGETAARLLGLNT